MEPFDPRPDAAFGPLHVDGVAPEDAQASVRRRRPGSVTTRVPWASFDTVEDPHERLAMLVAFTCDVLERTSPCTP